MRIQRKEISQTIFWNIYLNKNTKDLTGNGRVNAILTIQDAKQKPRILHSSVWVSKFWHPFNLGHYSGPSGCGIAITSPASGTAKFTLLIFFSFRNPQVLRWKYISSIRTTTVPCFCQVSRPIHKIVYCCVKLQDLHKKRSLRQIMRIRGI